MAEEFHPAVDVWCWTLVNECGLRGYRDALERGIFAWLE